MMSWLVLATLTFSHLPLETAVLGARSSFGGDDSGLAWLVIIGAVVVAVAVGIPVLMHILKRQARNSHPKLFDGLCKLHGLSRGNRALLKQLAASYGMSTPARLFTEPRWLEPNANSSLFRTRATELTAIRERLFGNGEAESPDAS